MLTTTKKHTIMLQEKKNQEGAQGTSAQEGFLQKNAKKVMIICGGVVVCILAVVLGFNIMSKRNAKAAEMLAGCEQYFQAGTLDKALDGDGQDCIGLVAVADKYGCTKAGNVAKLYAGLAYVQQNKLEEAKKYLEDFDAQDDEMISPAALMALGNVYVNLDQKEKGAETLVKAAKKAENNVISPVALVQAGEVYESLGQTDKALELYEEIKSKYRSSAIGGEIDKYIERAKLKK